MRRSRTFVVIASLMAAALVGCGDDGGDDEEVSRSTSTTVDEAEAPAGSTEAADGGSSTTEVSTSSPGAGDAATSTSSGVPDTPKDRPAQSPAGEAAPAPVPPGTYLYRVSGTARTSTGSFDVPPEAQLVVDPPQGADQRQTRKSDQGDLEQVLRFSGDGIRLVRQKVAAPQGSKEFRPEPPVVTVPHPLSPNQHWSWEMKSEDGLTTLKADLTALRREDVMVGGETVSTWVLRVVTSTSGDVTSNGTTTLWYSPHHRLVAKSHSQMKGTFGGVQYESDTTEELTSTKPV